MVEIIEKPQKRLVVGERVFYKAPDDLASFVALSAAGHPVAIYWAEGILFIPSGAFPDSEVMVERYLEGETHWASVAYARLDKFQEKMRIQGIEIPVVDVSRSQVMKEAAVWLKKRIEK